MRTDKEQDEQKKKTLKMSVQPYDGNRGVGKEKENTKSKETGRRIEKTLLRDEI